MNKTILIAFASGAALLVATGAQAFRDESQSAQINRVIKEKQAAAQKQTGVAGPVGTTGRVGPSTATNRVRKDPTAHP